jgi:hypothetical protein
MRVMWSHPEPREPFDREWIEFLLMRIRLSQSDPTAFAGIPASREGPAMIVSRLPAAALFSRRRGGWTCRPLSSGEPELYRLPPRKLKAELERRALGIEFNDVSTFCDWLRVRLIREALAYARAPVGPGRVSGTRLARLLFETITGRGDRDGDTDGPGGCSGGSGHPGGPSRARPFERGDADRKRVELYRQAMRESPSPSLPPALVEMMNDVSPQGKRRKSPSLFGPPTDIVWLGYGSGLGLREPGVIMPLGHGEYKAESTSSVQSLLHDEIATNSAWTPLVELVRHRRFSGRDGKWRNRGDAGRNPPAPESDHDEGAERRADDAFMQSLASEEGRTLRGTAPLYQGISLQLVQPDMIRLLISTPEHVAETGLGDYHVRWPASAIGTLIFCKEQYSSRGVIIDRFFTFDDRLAGHPIVNQERKGFGRDVCVADSALVVAYRLTAGGASTGAIVAQQLVTARDALLYGIHGGLSTKLYATYEQILSREQRSLSGSGQNAEPGGRPGSAGNIGKQILRRKQARELVARRNIELVPWNRKGGGQRTQGT